MQEIDVRELGFVGKVRGNRDSKALRVGWPRRDGWVDADDARDVARPAGAARNAYPAATRPRA